MTFETLMECLRATERAGAAELLKALEALAPAEAEADEPPNEVAEWQMTTPQAVLAELQREGGRLTTGELRRRLTNHTPNTVTWAVAVLKARGMVCVSGGAGRGGQWVELAGAAGTVTIC